MFNTKLSKTLMILLLAMSIGFWLNNCSVRILTDPDGGTTPPGQVAEPTFNPVDGTVFPVGGGSVAISTTTDGASIRYTTDGSTPSSTTGTVYSAPVAVSATTTIKAIAYLSGMTDSSVATATFTITTPPGQAAEPTFNPVDGTVFPVGGGSVAISTTTDGASIRYTTDGSTPSSTTGTVYSTPVIVSATTTIKAIAYLSGMTDSSLATATFTIATPPGQVAEPTFNPVDGTVFPVGGGSVAISTTTDGASIRYTTDGSTPSSTVGTVYSAPVAVSATTTIKAIAYLSGMTDSSVATATFTIQVAEPTFNPVDGTVFPVGGGSVAISTTTDGASIRYTTDGSAPSSTVGTVYSTPVIVSATTTIKAIAYLSGMTDSSVATADFTVTLPVVYAATDGGLSISTNGGDSFANKTTDDGLGNNLVYGVYVVGSNIYAATDGGLSISTNGGDSFANKTTDDGLGNNLVYGVYVVGSYVYAATNGGLSISTDGGESFTNKTKADNGLGNNIVRGVYVVDSDVYAATRGGLSISTDGGDSFANKTTENGLGSDIILGVYVVGSYVYAATSGGLSISTDGGGDSFANKTTENGLGNDIVYGVYVVDSDVYAATFGGLSISTNGGDSFANKTTENGLGANLVSGVYVVGSNVYAATTGGLSISTDGGDSFTNKTTDYGLGNDNVRGVYVVIP